MTIDDAPSTPDLAPADSPDRSACPGCGLVLAEAHGPTHRYLGASPACWALYGEVLAGLYADPGRLRLLQLVVDSYAVQHPGEPGRRTAQSVGIHLMTLCLCLEEGADPAGGPRLHRRMVERLAFIWLEPPAARGSLTIRELAEARTPGAFERAAWAWARDAWQAWSAHHEVVRSWLSDPARARA